LPLLDSTLASAVDSRKREYLAGRACAMLALSALGLNVSDLGRSRDRLPLWPAGFSGSISHTKNFVVACVTRDGGCETVGVDVENIVSDGVRAEIEDRILSRSEVSILSSLTDLESEACFTLGFSAKEATYKALYSLDKTYRDFSDLRLESVANAHGSNGGVFRMTDLKTDRDFLGQWGRESGRILSFVESRKAHESV
jgi:4'-phosphopantetheinyl transferase EntD